MNQAYSQLLLSKKIEDIEFLRGLAVLFVVIHHSRDNLFTRSYVWFDLFRQYFGLGIGVDIFFVISGFVITRQLIPKLDVCETGTQRMGQIISFWLRRCWRLLPSAWLWLIVIFVSTLTLNKSGTFGSARANYEATIAGFLQVANFRFGQLFGSEYGASFVYVALPCLRQQIGKKYALQ